MIDDSMPRDARVRWGRLSAAMLVVLTLAACLSSAERKAEEQRKIALAETYTQLGANYMQRGQFDFAKQNLDGALEANPDSPQANNMMALLQWRLKQYAEAQKYFRKALKLDNKNSEAWNNYGVFLCERGQYDTAEDAFRRALEDPLYKTPAEANVNAGLCQMRKPSPVAAEKHFRAALAINPRQHQALLALAKISYNKGQSLAARAFLQRYFDVAQETAEVLLLATKIEGALGNRDTEASYALRLRGKFPESAEAAQLKPTTDKDAVGRRSNKVQR